MSSGAGTILVVADEAEVGVMVQDCVGALGYEVDVATNGGDALMLASLSRPDAVVLDLRLPDGANVLPALCAMDASIAVVVLSEPDEEAAARATLRAGAFDYVRRPLDCRELQQALDLAVTVGREKSRPGGVMPLREGRAPALGDAAHAVRSCQVCSAPVRDGDTNAVIERGVVSHGPCWLEHRAGAR